MTNATNLPKAINVGILQNSEKTRGMSYLTIVLAVFFFFFTFVPTSYSLIRLGLLLLLFFAAVFSNGGVIKFDKTAGMILLAYVFYSIFTAIGGIVNDGNLKPLRTNVVYPFLFFFVFTAVLRKVRIETISKILIICACFVAASDLWVAFYSLGYFPIAPSILFHIDLGYIFNAGFGTYYQYTSTHMVSHFFLAPFVTTLVIKSFRDKRVKYKLIPLMLMQLLCIYFSGRAALILAYCITFLLLMLYMFRDSIRRGRRKLMNQKHLPRTLMILFVLIIALTFLLSTRRINIGGVANYVAGKLRGVYTKTRIVDTRASQRIEYVSGWLESPIVGHGMGTGVPYLRNGVMIDDKAIELTYIQMLYQTGIIGTALFFLIAFYAIRGLSMKIKRKEISLENGLPYLFGLIGILLGAESNPYLFTMGCIWMLYLPFSMAAIDPSSLKRGKTNMIEV